VAPDTCPLCGTDVALLRRPARPSEKDLRRERIMTLQARAEALDRGALTPRKLKEEALWMCGACRPIIAGPPPLDGQEIRRRIHDEVRRLARRAS
jgi:hypothetical protein